MTTNVYSTTETDAKIAAALTAAKAYTDSKITGTPTPPTPTPNSPTFWTASSLWNTGKVNSTFVSGAADTQIRSCTGWLNNDAYSHPTYITKTTDPTVTINLGLNQNGGATGGTMTVPAPAGMVPASGGDGCMAIYAPDGSYIDGYQVKKNSETNFSFSQYVRGNWKTDTGFGTQGTWQRAGTTAIGCPQSAGTILARDVAAGVIPHGLFLVSTYGNVLGNGTTGTYDIAPAVGNDIGNSTGPIPQGALLLIPAGTAMPGGLNAMGKALFNALQTYGGYMCDQAGGGNPFMYIVGDGSSAVTSAFNGVNLSSILQLLRFAKTWS